MNYPELRPDIAEIFDEASRLGTERLREIGHIFAHADAHARRVLVDQRTRTAREARGIAPVVVEPARPGGQAWRARPFVDQHGTRYESTRDAAARTGAKHPVIFAVLKGERKSTHGFIFRYV